MKDQGIFSLVIILLSLITLSLENVWIMLGENWCWSLLGLKGLIQKPYYYGQFALSLGKESPYIFCKVYPLNLDIFFGPTSVHINGVWQYDPYLF